MRQAVTHTPSTQPRRLAERKQLKAPKRHPEPGACAHQGRLNRRSQKRTLPRAPLRSALRMLAYASRSALDLSGCCHAHSNCSAWTCAAGPGKVGLAALGCANAPPAVTATLQHACVSQPCLALRGEPHSV